VRALAANRQATSVTQAAIAADVHEALDIELNLFAQIAFDIALLIDDSTNPADFFFVPLHLDESSEVLCDDGPIFEFFGDFDDPLNRLEIVRSTTIW